MTTRTVVVFTLAFLCAAVLSAQTSLSGRLLSDTGEPLGFANVLLLQPSDSTLVKGELTDDRGRFQFSDLPAGDYLLQVTMLGYAARTEALTLTADQPTNLPDWTLETEAALLSTVEVTAKKPFLEQQAGKLVVNVAESLTGQSGSTIDLLKKVPGLVVVRDRISLAGQSNVTILIDGRPTRYMDLQSLLKEMPAADIEKIEVISQPGAAFDAEGTGGVINIILKKNVKLGTNGSVTAGLGYGWGEKLRLSTNLNHRKGPVNLYGTVSLNHRVGYERLLLLRRVDSLTFNQNNFTPYRPLSGYTKVGMDYDLNDRHRVGLSGRVTGGINNRINDNTTFIYGPADDLQDQLLTTNDVERDWGTVGADAYYTFTIDTSGRKFSLDASAARFARTGLSTITTTNTAAPFSDRQNDEPGSTNIAALKADYVHPFSKQWKVEAGLKWSYADIDNDLRAYSRDDENSAWVNLPGVSNRFQYTENIGAGYLSLAWQREKWQANAGLRYEYTSPRIYSVTLDSLVQNNYGKLFPSLGISGPVAGKLGWDLSYSYRIERPSYYSLNPFIQYLDPFTFERGNPYLRPEFTHGTKLSITFDKQPFFNLEYSHTSNTIQLVTEQDDATGATFAYDANLDEQERYGGSLFFPLEFVKGMSGYGGVMAYYTHFTSNYLNSTLDRGRWNVTGFIQLNYDLPLGVKSEISGWYSGGGQEGLMRFRPLYGMSLGLEKKLWDERATINLSVDDLLFQYYRAELVYLNMDLDINSQWETRVVNLSFTYKFGNRYLKQAERRRSGIAEEEKRANVKN